jgi:hypothetical protein
MTYLGKAASLRSRFRDYVEMVRRLMALYAGFEVWSDGNGFRYVHYEIANALLLGNPVYFDYFIASAVKTGQALARLEQLEIASAVMAYHVAGKCDFLVLNAMDNIRSPVHGHLSPAWQAVQRVV